MKWLPVPSVPRWLRTVAAFASLDRRALDRTRASSSAQAAPRSGASPHAPRSPRPPLFVRPCGTARSIAERSGARLSGRSSAAAWSCTRHHAAADVDADRGRDDRALGRDHAADGRADAPVDVGHHRDVRVDERPTFLTIGDPRLKNFYPKPLDKQLGFALGSVRYDATNRIGPPKIQRPRAVVLRFVLPQREYVRASRGAAGRHRRIVADAPELL